jgi:RAT1-interacting protein
VPTVNIGFRTPPGRIQSVSSFETASFPRRVRGKRGQGAWDANVVLGWGARALEFVRRSIEETKRTPTEKVGERAKEVWRVELRPAHGMAMWMLEGERREEVQRDEEVERVGFLPTWYWDAVNGGPDRTGGTQEGIKDGPQEELGRGVGQDESLVTNPRTAAANGSTGSIPAPMAPTMAGAPSGWNV